MSIYDNIAYGPRCQGIKDKKLGLARYIKDFKGYDPAHPDDVNAFVWDLSPFTEIEKPDGN